MKRWVRSGLVWGGILYVLSMVIFPLIDHERFDLEKLLMGIPLWIVVGFTIGYLFERKKKNKNFNRRTL